MLFSSMTFIYLFLPVVLVLYFVLKPKYRNYVLLLASIIFYAWGEPKYVVIMFLTILINYFGAILIDKFHKYKAPILITAIICDLSFLIYFKYFNFIIDNFNSLFNGSIEPLNIIMPIGISFYTFQAMSYIIDVYRSEVKVQKNIYKLALFICLFPQLIAGPILKYHDVEAQIENRKVDFDKVNIGVKRFIIGLSKKVLIANTMGLVADKIFAQNPHCFSHSTAWLGAISYSLQLYFDFSGYSDMAIGLGLILGFNFMENFNYPYISRSVSEFWRRWHISLSTWFKQYVYIPLGGNRGSQLTTCRNLGVVFLLTGIWHGASWTFVLWGIWHGLFIIIEKMLNIKEYEKQTHPLWQEILRHIYCIIIFVTGWVIFRADNIKYACDYLLNMFGLLHVHKKDFVYSISYYFDNLTIIIMVIAILCAIPVFKNIIKIENKYLKAFVNIWLLFLFFFSTIKLASDTYNPFIYFRF
ncbi:MAG: MBOAT family protein [Candidatus Gastranaerophilales bacterium]|nr:MBOAT family protein [Candidatus Gastranaerophilales bacterium]